MFERSLYKEVTDKIGHKLGPSFAPDRAWLEACERKHAQTQVRALLPRRSARVKGYFARRASPSWMFLRVGVVMVHVSLNRGRSGSRTSSRATRRS